MSAVIVIGGLFYIMFATIGVSMLIESWQRKNRPMGISWRVVGTCLFMITVIGPPLILASVAGWLP